MPPSDAGTWTWTGPGGGDEHRPGREDALDDAHRAESGPVIDYHFPVEVHTVGTLPPEERERLARTPLDRLAEELNARL